MKKNEPVYIDGINISECAYALAPVNYQKEISCIACKASITKLNFCKRNPDCYFKQLKRKELEYGKLKQEYDEAFGAIDNVRQAKEDLQKEKNHYQKTLKQIKEIAWVNPVNTCWESLNLCDKCEEKKDCEMQSPFVKLKLILQKVNEALDVSSNSK